MTATYERDTIFFSQVNRQESFRPPDDQRYSKTVFEYPSDIAGTANGLICVLKYGKGFAFSRSSTFRVFVMNVATGIRRELPSPRITTERPLLVQMKANVNDGYTITFIYTRDRDDLQVTSLQVYDSVKNVGSNDEGRAIADFKDVEAFNMSYSLDSEVHYDFPAFFHKKTKTFSVFNLHEGEERDDPSIYPSNPNGHVHNVSGESYELCTREGRHDVWRLLCSSKWEMVCECPDLERVWTCLRVMNDLVVLIIELPVPYGGISELYEEDGVEEDFPPGGIVKVFHMPTKVWHSFPEDEHFTARFCYSIEFPFLTEIRFDSVP